MKKLTTEEKAQIYDKTLKRARKELQACGSSDCDAARQIFRFFPELKESEDEKIIQFLIHEVKETSDKIMSYRGMNKEAVLDWLEKQGKKTEPIEGFDTEFERQISYIIASAINKEYEYTEDSVKRASNALLNYAKHEIEKQGEPTDINPSEFELLLNKLLKQFESLPKEELESRLSFYLNVVQNDGTYKDEEKRVEKKTDPRYKYLEELLAADNIYQMAMNVDMVQEAKTKALNALSELEISKLLGLEKQGEQNLADKVDPKFKVGDWCIDNKDGTIFQIMKVLGNIYPYYTVKTNEGKEYSCTHYSLKNDARLWTIQDAKDGDVLACESGWTCIFKSLNAGDTFSSYCFMDRTKSFFETGSECHTLNEEFTKAYNGEIKPATKEQCDAFFARMKEAGYEWDTDKKELKKNIDEKQIKKNLQDNGFRRILEQKPVECHREDEQNLNACLGYIPDEFLRRWLKDAIHTRFDKPVDKPEPKFNIGDWVVDEKGVVKQILSYKNNVYKHTYGYSAKMFEDEWRLWDITKDAREGDVLEFGDHGRLLVGIVSYINKSTGKVDVSCLLEDNKFKIGNYYALDTINPHPATKEQCDLLFQKMKEDGYKWDDDKKKLAKSEIMIKAGRNYRCTKSHIYAGLDWLEGTKYYAAEDYSLVNNGCTCFCPKYSKYEHNNLFEEVECDGCIEKQCEQNLAWSEDDELYIRELESLVKQVWAIAEHENDKETIHKMSDLSFFLKTLKPRPVKEWNKEDEKIRNFISNELACLRATDEKGTVRYNELTEAIAWLEKKGEQETLCDKCRKEQPSHSCQDITELGRCAVEHEQKSACKVEPKFKVGDWIVFNGLALYVKEVVNGFYRTVSKSGITNSYDWSIDNVARLWTIQDAKDGDVLCTYESDEPKIVFILKGIAKKHYALDYHCYYNIVYPHFESDSEKGCLSPSNKDVRPATKEQRDLLFQKMKEAGYEWHADEKELYLNWSPSEKQLKTLEKWLSIYRYDESSRYDWQIFDSLYKDLKKLAK